VVFDDWLLLACSAQLSCHLTHALTTA